MKTEVKVIADSVSPNFERLTTLQVCFPRFILAEVNTHRVLSRNYRSSRAVPVEKLIAEVERSPFVPLAFGRSEEHTSELQSLMRISYAVFCLKKKKHKQIII